MAVRKLIKSSNGERAWKSMSSSVKKEDLSKNSARSYTPQGRMVSKPAGRRPRHMP